MISSLLMVVRPVFLIVGLFVGLVPQFALAQSDPLPSWNDRSVEKSISDFVTRVTAQAGTDFVPVDWKAVFLFEKGTKHDGR